MSAQGSFSGSMSSTATTSYTFNNVIKDFKKALGERKTPKNLTILNRIMVAILLATVVLTSVNYSTLITESSMV
jgi:hypothetical protein